MSEPTTEGLSSANLGLPVKLPPKVTPAAPSSSLDAFLAESEVIEPERFVVDGRRSAEWALARLSEAREAMAVRQAEYDHWRSKIDQWLAAVTAPITASIERFEALLTSWHVEILAAEEKLGVPDRRLTKSIPLPSGRLASTAGRQSVEITDEAAFVAWAKANRPEWLRSAPDKAAIKAAIKAVKGVKVYWEGEEVPGVELRTGPRTFRVETTPRTALEAVTPVQDTGGEQELERGQE